jgi:hypothetical protein
MELPRVNATSPRPHANQATVGFFVEQLDHLVGRHIGLRFLRAADQRVFVGAAAQVRSIAAFACSLDRVVITVV